MELNIIPYQSVGPIKLGMTRHEVRSVLNSKVEEFKKGRFSESLTDSFDDLDIHVHYTKNDTCEAVEIFENANPTFENHVLIGSIFNEMKTTFEKYDENLELDSTGLTSKKLGIGLYVHDFEEGNEPVTSVIVFEKGYYQS